MDHLQMSIVPKLQMMRVPVLVHNRFMYDGGGFDGFPERVKFDVRQLWDDNVEDECNGYDRLAFLQSWLYFAFAHQIFGHILKDTPMPLTPSALSQIEADDHGNLSGWIDSQSVPIAATAWMALHELSTEEESYERMLAVIAVLKHVSGILHAIFNAMDHNRVSYFRHDEKTLAPRQVPISHGVLISILLLAEQIDTAFDAIYVDPRFQSRVMNWSPPFKLIPSLSKYSGCCRRQMVRMIRGSRTPTTLLMWQYLMRQILPQQDHSSCSIGLCHVNIPGTHLPVHDEIDCSCEDTRLSPAMHQKLSTIVSSGRIPVLRATKSAFERGPASLELAEYVPGSKDWICVAISHVWSDGLGTPDDNRMPSCQILKLQALSEEVSQRLEEYDLSPKPQVGFWIDTMCIPVSLDPEIRKHAIMQMTDIYKNASTVLVLDKFLRTCSTDTGSLSIMWLIYTSRWYQRLWTLQEGILNSRTHILLSDDMPTIEWFVQSYDSCETLEKPVNEYRNFIKENIHTSRPCRPKEYSAQLLDPVYRYLRFALMETRRTINEPALRAMRVLHQLSWRQASVATDEIICLAILTSFPLTSSFLGLDIAFQLAAIMKRLERVPALVLFFPGPRLTLPGCRWIPRSFLDRNFSGLDDWFDNFGEPTDEGLLVQLPAIVEKSRKIQVRIDKEGGDLFTAAKLHLVIDGVDYMVTSIEPADEFYSTFFTGEMGGVLLHDKALGELAPENRFANGVMARVDKIVGEVTYVTPFTRCQIHQRRNIYGQTEWYPEIDDTGMLKDIDGPMIEPDAMWLAAWKSEAEFLLPKMYCVG